MTPRASTAPRPIRRLHEPPAGAVGPADQARIRAALRVYRHQLAGPRVLDILALLWSSDLAGLEGARLDRAIRERFALRENARWLVAGRLDPRDRVEAPTREERTR